MVVTHPNCRLFRYRASSVPLYRAPDWLVLHDISTQGNVLLSRNSIRIGTSCQPPGETSERDLSWLVASSVSGLSSDGQTVVFMDALSGRTREGNPMIFRRSVDGSPAVALGEGGMGPLSPDGRWVLGAERTPDPPADRRRLDGDAAARRARRAVGLAHVAWLTRSVIVFTGYSADGTPRGYIQETPAGQLLGDSPPTSRDWPAKPAVRDERLPSGSGPATGGRLFPIDGVRVGRSGARAAREIPVNGARTAHSSIPLTAQRAADAASTSPVFRAGYRASRALENTCAARFVGVETSGERRHHAGRAVLLLFVYAPAW